MNARWGLEGAFFADAATFLVGALVALRIRIEPVPRDAERARHVDVARAARGRSRWRAAPAGCAGR